MTVLQKWVCDLTYMQQTVLLTSIRGPDDVAKYSNVKMLLRWLRRCILISALDGAVLRTPEDKRGGSFTGPSVTNVPDSGWETSMDEVVGEYLKVCDALPHHFQTHFMHAAEIIGYKHPDIRIRNWWNGTYNRIVKSLHLLPETEEHMDNRLGDSRHKWLETCDEALTE